MVVVVINLIGPKVREVINCSEREARRVLQLIEEGAGYLGVATDHVIESFRNELWEGYKTGEGIEPALRAQFHPLEESLVAMGVTVWPMIELEADDGLATGARKFRDEVDQVRIMTPDKDLGQCIQGDRVVQVDRRQKKLTNESAFRAERGFGPESMADFLALAGDSADGFPGLTGFGKKTASMLLGVYQKIEQIPEDPADWKVKPRGAPQLAATLVEHRADALLYRKLATLVDTVPLECSLKDLEFRGVPRARFERWCDELGVQRLKAVPKRWQHDA